MKILVIEDDELLSKALKANLEKEGHTVDYVNDGAAGQKRIDMYHDTYDLIILDLILPNITGEEICKHVREKKIYVPILVLTGMEAVDRKVSVLDAGADDYLTKPFSIPELIARVRALLRRPRVALPSLLKAGDVVLDPASRRVFRAEQEIHLTLKEFKLLEHLMRHPNQVVTRDQLLEHVWDFNFDSFSNLVDVHINKLRKKLTTDKTKAIIETIRGVGYRLAVE